MSGIKRTIQKGFKKKVRSITDPLKKVFGLDTPKAPEAEDPFIIPIPDERVAELEARKRRAKTLGTGRESTILTEGLGG